MTLLNRVQLGRMRENAASRFPLTIIDVGVAALLVGLTVAYMASWPRDFYWEADEGQFLYEAKRVLDGDVIYRDFFEIITPASVYVMALLFWLFGVDLATARVAMAVVHAGIMLALYLSCRALGVRLPLAVFPAVAHLALCHPQASIATPHWISTLLVSLLLLICLRRGPAPGPWSALLPGLLTGTLIAVQQQRGLPFAAGVGGLLVVEYLCATRYGSKRSPLGSTLAVYALGLVASFGVWMIPIAIAAGSEPLVAALIYFPLFNYSRVNRVTWGWYASLLPRGWIQLFIIYLPAILIVPLARATVALLRKRAEDATRQHIVLIVFGLISVLSIAYKPDYTHLALIAGVFFVTWADSLDWLFRMGERLTRAVPIAGSILAFACVAWLLLHSYAHLHLRWAMYPHVHETPFGRVNFHTQGASVLGDSIRKLVINGEQNGMFCYHSCAGLYLMTETTNPTRFQQLIPGYNSTAQFNEVFSSLDQHKTPLVVMTLSPWARWAGDPMNEYLARHYARVQVPLKMGMLPPYLVFERRSTPRIRPGSEPEVF